MASGKRKAVCGIILLVGVLGGCAREQNPEFVTSTAVDLRDGEGDEAGIVARLPAGTPVVPTGRVGGECLCWQVSTAQGSGWLDQRFISMK